MAGHLTYDPATGHLLFSENGHLALNCGQEGADCGDCPDATPYQYDITFASVVMCTDCFCFVGDTECAAVRSGALDGTYRLTQDATQPSPNPCIWRGTASITVDYWGGSGGCGGAPTATLTTFNITLLRAGTTFRATVVATGIGSPEWDLFYGEGTSTNCSSSLPTINNDYTECVPPGIGNPIIGAYDGYATLAVV